MKYLVLDTNVYLHYKDFEQVDWQSLVGDDVTICVPAVVLGEIDKHKDQNRGKIQKRAKKLSSRFYEIFLLNAETAIAVKEMDNPPSTAFDDTKYHKDINDDWIILSALHSSYDFSDIIIVSGDNGLLLKAKHSGLGFFKMPDDLRISEELSEEEKEIKKLKERLAKHEARLPQPLIEFENRTDHLVIHKLAFIDIRGQLDIYETQLKEEHPYRTDMNNVRWQTRSINRVADYNEKLDDYYKKKIELKRRQLEKELLDQRFVRIDFWLGNIGTSSLGETVVFITFPSNVALYDEDSKTSFTLEDPKEPLLNDSRDNIMENFASVLDYHDKEYEDIEMWDVDKMLDNHKLNYSSSKLVHNLCTKITTKEPIYVDLVQCGNFIVKWTVFDSELIEPVNGELHVIIEEANLNNQN